MASGGLILGSLPIFDGKGYDDWCVKMDVILGFQEIDEVVKVGFKEPPKNADEEVKKTYKGMKKLDCKARVLLHQCVAAPIFQKISKALTAKEVWEILQNGYGNFGKMKKVKLQSLRRQYELLSMTEKENVAEYFDRLQVITNAMRACDENIEDNIIVEKVLRTLTPRFDHVVVAIEESRDLDVMTIEELQNSLEAHEQRVNERKNGEKVTEQALQAKVSYGVRGRGRSGWRGRGRGRSRGRSGGRNSETET